MAPTDSTNPTDTSAEARTAPWPPLARLRFRLEALDPLAIPAYPGSAWRGLLGRGLRQTACVTRAPQCDGCLLRTGCVYSTLFETPALDPAGAGEGGRYSKLPHPFVLDLDLPPGPGGAVGPGRGIAPGESTWVGLAVLGGAIAQIPYLIHAMAIAGQRGLGRENARFALVALEREGAPGRGDWQPVYTAADGRYLPQPTHPPEPPAAAPQALSLRLLTPLRLKRHGHFVGAAEIEPADLLRNLAARVALLATHYGGDPRGLEWRAVEPLARTVRATETRVRWHDWTRYSSRQDTLMQMGGLLGEIRLEGPGLAPLWPLLWYGQWVHVGKGTSFGLGAYTLD